MDYAALIKDIIYDEMAKAKPPFPYRDPIIGYASASDPMYNCLDTLIGNKQAHPKEILPTAKTILVYFIPYSEEMVKCVRERSSVPIRQEWSDYYTVTNQLLTDINIRLEKELAALGVTSASQPPTDNYDDTELTAKWAHKSSAVIAGIGSFGLNHLLITKSGTMGRLNSLILDVEIEPTPRPESSYCLYYKNGSCKFCVNNCPSGALNPDGTIDKFRCDAYLTGKNVRNSQQGCPGCSCGPCATKGF